MRQLTVDGTQLAVHDEGTGSPLILIHGFPLDHTMWQRQIAALAQRHRVVAPDLRGFGNSEVTDGTVTMQQMADDVAGILDALGIGEPVAFCGLSMGGYVAWQFWERHRRRLAALILCDTRAAADTPEAAANRHTTAEEVLRDGPDALAETMIPKLLCEATRKDNPDLVTSLRRVIRATDPRGIAAASRGMAERPDFTPRLPEIDCPTLVVVGEHDAISTVDEMRSIAGAIPGAELAVISHSGHMSPMENPEEVNSALAGFLQRTSASPAA